MRLLRLLGRRDCRLGPGRALAVHPQEAGYAAQGSRLRGTIRYNNEKSAQRDANTARALAIARFGHRPPAVENPQTGPITIHCAAHRSVIIISSFKGRQLKVKGAAASIIIIYLFIMNDRTICSLCKKKVQLK